MKESLKDEALAVQTALQGSELRYRRLFESAKDGILILNDRGDSKDFLQLILSVLKDCTGFDAVGIRLQDGDDFPYFVQEGFPDDFLATENTLTERIADGGVCLDEDGWMRRRLPPGDPSTSPGSFWPLPENRPSSPRY